MSFLVLRTAQKMHSEPLLSFSFSFSPLIYIYIYIYIYIKGEREKRDIDKKNNLWIKLKVPAVYDGSRCSSLSKVVPDPGQEGSNRIA